MTFDELWEKWPWRPIRNCPGRFVLPADVFDGSLEALTGTRPKVREFRAEGARDPVCVAELKGGGLISYRKPEGTFVHTLNTTEGFRRKLEDLGVNWPQDHPAG